jgi:beta-N-acetylhexosaminidase
MSSSAFIAGCAGPALSTDEHAFFRDAQPFGFILFARNCESPEQITALVDDLRDSVGRADAPVLIDQEGGRVQRLRPPHWRSYPSGAHYGSLYGKDSDAALRATYLVTRLMAADLHQLGITVDCVPVLDVRQHDAHEVIGNRAYGTETGPIVAIGRVVAQAMIDGGVLPVIKHVPGHGRAHADSHKSLPVVDTSAEVLRSCDFVPFIELCDLPMAMTAHVVYADLDAQAPATQSSIMVDLIREEIGFKGLLLTDDIGMGALSGSMAERAELSLKAGCDMVLHCNGDLVEMIDIATIAPAVSGQCATRCAQVLGMLHSPSEFDVDEAIAELDRALRESV